MPIIHLVRHARPSAGWGQDPDPGLDPVGVSQARATAAELVKAVDRAPLYSSPLRRCRETALALEQSWDRVAEICHPVAEIPAPPLDLSARHAWLVDAMRGTWDELQQSAPAGSPDYLQWRSALLRHLASLRGDCVIFTHFIAINVVVGAARGNDAVVCFKPDHASVTTMEVAGSSLRVVRLGREAQTTVLARN
jgi:broad specificity phosphatase PhoE